MFENIRILERKLGEKRQRRGTTDNKKNSGYTLCTRYVEEMGMQFMSREIRKGVNTNLGMMLPGTLVRENTRIKKKYCSGIFIHKALYRMSLHVKDAPILVASFFFLPQSSQTNDRER